MSRIGAVLSLLAAAIVKAGMVMRVSRGLPPLEDTYTVEYSGRLMMLVGGVLFPLAQLSLGLVLLVSLVSLLLEELQGETLRGLGVNIEEQRGRRYFTVGLLLVAVLLVITPPQPSADSGGPF